MDRALRARVNTHARAYTHTHKHKTQMLEEVSKHSLVAVVQKYLEQLQIYTLK